MPASTPQEEIFQPIAAFIERIEDLSDLLEVATTGIEHLLNYPHMIEEMMEDPEGPSFEDLTEARRLAELARRQEESGFETLYAQAAVSVWAGLELAIDDLAATLLKTFPQVTENEPLSQVKVTLLLPDALQPIDRASSIVEALKETLRRKGSLADSTGIRRFERLLSLFGFPDPVPSSTLPKKDRTYEQDLKELWAFRNLYAHGRLEADQRFVDRCPHLGLKIGDRVRVRLEEYVSAASFYAGTVAERARNVADRLLAIEGHPGHPRA